MPEVQWYCIMIFILKIVVVSLMVNVAASSGEVCNYEVVESVPDKLHLNRSESFQPKITHESLIELIDSSKHTLNIASFYVFLNANSEFQDHPTAFPGKLIMESITRAANRGVRIQVVIDQSSPRTFGNPHDIEYLKTLGTVKTLNMTKFFGAGVMHSKFLIADSESFYLGSSNFDWRSYSHIKEIGISVTQCKTLAQDLEKIFNLYVFMSDQDHVPEELPQDFHTKINSENPFSTKVGSLDSKVFLTGSPPPFLGGADRWIGRTNDIDALVDVIDKARERVDISVMNYNPRTEFIWPKKFWPKIDDALRRAASERQVQVRLLFTDWSKEEQLMWYRSLNAVQSKSLSGGGIHVKLYNVPAFDDFQKKVPFARVKHDKYMVTEKALFIGTSNWTPEYFINTCGVSLVIEPANPKSNLNGTIIDNMRDLFERDFYSEHAHEL